VFPVLQKMVQSPLDLELNGQLRLHSRSNTKVTLFELHSRISIKDSAFGIYLRHCRLWYQHSE